MNYAARLKKIQSLIKKENIDVYIIEEPIDLIYMTGLQLSAGKLLISTKGATLFVDGRYREACRKHSPYPVLPVDKASIIEWFRLPENSTLKTLGFDSSKTTHKRFLELSDTLNEICSGHKDNVKMELVSKDSLVNVLREVKDAEEIELLRKAAELGSLGFDYVYSLLKEGITELEVASELEIFWKRKGGQALAFDSIIAFGANSSMPHYRPQNIPLVKGSPVLIDIGVKLGNYHSDMTRTVFFGPPSKTMEEIYEVVREAQQKALDISRPGVTVRELDQAAREHIASKGYGELFSHNLGHGVGLEIHEAPTLNPAGANGDKCIEVGMVITIEPGVYLPDLGGVRIEDTIVITAEGHENLTLRPKGLLVVEST